MLDLSLPCRIAVPEFLYSEHMWALSCFNSGQMGWSSHHHNGTSNNGTLQHWITYCFNTPTYVVSCFSTSLSLYNNKNKIMDDQTKNSNNLLGSSLRTIIYWYWLNSNNLLILGSRTLYINQLGFLKRNRQTSVSIEVDPESGLVGSSRGTWVPFKDLQKACHAKKIWTMKQWSI